MQIAGMYSQYSEMKDNRQVYAITVLQMQIMQLQIQHYMYNAMFKLDKYKICSKYPVISHIFNKEFFTMLPGDTKWNLLWNNLTYFKVWS